MRLLASAEGHPGILSNRLSPGDQRLHLRMLSPDRHAPAQRHRESRPPAPLRAKFSPGSPAGASSEVPRITGQLGCLQRRLPQRHPRGLHHQSAYHFSCLFSQISPRYFGVLRMRCLGWSIPAAGHVKAIPRFLPKRTRPTMSVTSPSCQSSDWNGPPFVSPPLRCIHQTPNQTKKTPPSWTVWPGDCFAYAEPASSLRNADSSNLALGRALHFHPAFLPSFPSQERRLKGQGKCLRRRCTS
jgi:hypothetical protein